MRYTDQARVEGYLNRPLSDSEGLIIDDVIESISEYVNGYTNRSWFSLDSDKEDEATDYPEEATVRYFDGDGNSELFIDDYIDLESVEILDRHGNVWNTYGDTDYQSLPVNRDLKGSIQLRFGRFPEGVGNIKVTAKWGAGKPPKSVVVVTTILVGKFFKKAEGNSNQFKSESIEGYSYTLQTNAEHDSEIVKALEMLGKYRKILI